MKKVIIFIVFAALIGLGIHQMKQVYQPGVQQNVDIESLPEITGEDIPSINTYTREGISFQYPEEVSVMTLGVTSKVWRTNAEIPGVLIADLRISDSMQPNTNFRDAKFTVGSSTDKQALKECLIPTNGERAKGETTINGVVFKKITLTEAAAGNYYDSTSYRAIKNNTCYAVEYTIHSTNLRNYDPGTVEEFDTQAVVRTLEGMTQSFTFLN